MKSSSILPMTEWQGKPVSVLGFGQSGRSAASLLLELGADVTILEERTNEDLVETSQVFLKRGAKVFLGGGFHETVDMGDLLVLSPGVSTDHELVQRALKLSVPVIGELELASWFLEGPIIAVTGTNGKSTTVRLIGAILEQCGKKPFVGGNLGVPLCEAVEKSSKTSDVQEYDFLVVEVSSFQLETIHRFHPWIAVLLNITPDHLDRHKTEEEYISTKRRIFENQQPGDWSLVNADDPIVESCMETARGSRMTFSVSHRVDVGVFLENQAIRARIGGKEFHVIQRDQIPLRGHHNVENVLAAIGVSLLCGCSTEGVANALKRQSGFEHVLEPVRQWRGITFINDSKGTNVDATLKAIKSFHEPLVLIMGGKDKGGDFSRLRESVGVQAKEVILIGEAASQMAAALDFHPAPKFAQSLEKAIAYATLAAVEGDVVLFSPACASFDMFRNYHHRGMEFKRIVKELQ